MIGFSVFSYKNILQQTEIRDSLPVINLVQVLNSYDTILADRSKGQGRGLIAKHNIKKDEIIFELSRDSIINIDTAALTRLQSNNKNILMGLNQWQALILCLSYELYLNEKSKWFSYFNVLPLTSNDFNSLMYWKDEDLEYLKPSTVLLRIGKKEAEELYLKLVPEYCEKLGCKELSEFLTLEKFHIIASLIMSYSFDVDRSFSTSRYVQL